MFYLKPPRHISTPPAVEKFFRIADVLAADAPILQMCGGGIKKR
jgi:hypothetical protein